VHCLSGRPISSSFGHNVSSVQKFADDMDGTRNCTFCAKIMGTPRDQMNCQSCQSLQSCQYKRCRAYVHMNGCPPDIEAHPGYYGIWVTRDLGSSNIATIPNLILSFSNKVQFSEACLVCQPKGADFLPIKALDLILHAKHIAYLTTVWKGGNHNMLSKCSWRGEDKTFFEKGEDFIVRLAFNLLFFALESSFCFIGLQADRAKKYVCFVASFFTWGKWKKMR
jgi:hypothetical protein